MKFTDPYTGQSELYERLPGPKRRFLGMQRHMWERLGAAGLVEIVEVKRPGYSRGIKLLYVPSAYAYLDGLRSTTATNSLVAKSKTTNP